MSVFWTPASKRTECLCQPSWMKTWQDSLLQVSLERKTEDLTDFNFFFFGGVGGQAARVSLPAQFVSSSGPAPRSAAWIRAGGCNVSKINLDLQNSGRLRYSLGGPKGWTPLFVYLLGYTERWGATGGGVLRGLTVIFVMSRGNGGFTEGTGSILSIVTSENRTGDILSVSLMMMMMMMLLSRRHIQRHLVGRGMAYKHPHCYDDQTTLF